MKALDVSSTLVDRRKTPLLLVWVADDRLSLVEPLVMRVAVERVLVVVWVAVLLQEAFLQLCVVGMVVVEQGYQHVWEWMLVGIVWPVQVWARVQLLTEQALRQFPVERRTDKRTQCLALLAVFQVLVLVALAALAELSGADQL